jgi:hypothetical protein
MQDVSAVAALDTKTGETIWRQLLPQDEKIQASKYHYQMLLFHEIFWLGAFPLS